jgi:chitin disaccharide deacetylase
MTLNSPRPSLLSRLGLTGRAVVLHVDDLGLCRGANDAFLTLAARGLVTCGSVMVPAPAFPDLAEAAAADPSLDVGVHLTLTSEWPALRWAPVSRVSPASGLTDGDGWLWPDVASLRRHLVPEAAEAELRAQIERALAAGLHPTHIDAHMAAAMLPELLDAHIRLGLEYGLVPVLPRAITFAPDVDRYGEAVARLDAAGLPVLDHIRGTLPVPAEQLAPSWRAVVDGLAPGVTHVALHCTTPGEIEAIAPGHAAWRTNEYALLASGALADWLAESGVTPVGYRAIQRLWRAG